MGRLNGPETHGTQPPPNRPGGGHEDRMNAKRNHAGFVMAAAESDIAAGREWDEEDQQVYEEAQTVVQTDSTEQRIEELAKLSPVEPNGANHVGRCRKCR